MLTYPMRVLAPETNMRLIISCNGRTIKQTNMRKVNPAEMVHVDLKAKELEACDEIEARLENAK